MTRYEIVYAMIQGSDTFLLPNYFSPYQWNHPYTYTSKNVFISQEFLPQNYLLAPYVRKKVLMFEVHVQQKSQVLFAVFVQGRKFPHVIQ